MAMSEDLRTREPRDGAADGASDSPTGPTTSQSHDAWSGDEARCVRSGSVVWRTAPEQEHDAQCGTLCFGTERCIGSTVRRRTTSKPVRRRRVILPSSPVNPRSRSPPQALRVAEHSRATEQGR